MTTCATCRTPIEGEHCSSCVAAAATPSNSWATHPGWDAPLAASEPTPYGGARFLGDAAPVAALSRFFNAACYIVTGIAMFVGSGQVSGQAWIPILLGIAGVGYGLKILATRTSYWVSSVIYVLPVLAVCWAIASIAS
jgi:hypothetical protein